MTREEAIDCLAVMYERSREGKRVYHNKYQDAFDMAMDALEAQAERTEERTKTHACDLISRQAAIDAIVAQTIGYTVDEIKAECEENIFNENGYLGGLKDAIEAIEDMQSAQPEKRTEERTETHGVCLDTISRQDAIRIVDSIDTWQAGWRGDAIESLKALPSAQPERTCVNCGRTINNGGWYADGRTRCPIEEHYALPKDGYCHLWEKRNVTDDDYPERRTDGRD